MPIIWFTLEPIYFLENEISGYVIHEFTSKRLICNIRPHFLMRILFYIHVDKIAFCVDLFNWPFAGGQMVREGRQVSGQEAEEERDVRWAGEGHHDAGPEDALHHDREVPRRTTSGKQKLFLRNGPNSASFVFIFVFFKQTITILTTNIWKNVMTIQYTVPGFEPTTFGTWVSSHSHSRSR